MYQFCSCNIFPILWIECLSCFGKFKELVLVKLLLKYIHNILGRIIVHFFAGKLFVCVIAQMTWYLLVVSGLGIIIIIVRF